MLFKWECQRAVAHQHVTIMTVVPLLHIYELISVEYLGSHAILSCSAQALLCLHALFYRFGPAWFNSFFLMTAGTGNTKTETCRILTVYWHPNSQVFVKFILKSENIKLTQGVK